MAAQYSSGSFKQSPLRCFNGPVCTHCKGLARQLGQVWKPGEFVMNWEIHKDITSLITVQPLPGSLCSFSLPPFVLCFLPWQGCQIALLQFLPPPTLPHSACCNHYCAIVIPSDYLGPICFCLPPTCVATLQSTAHTLPLSEFSPQSRPRILSSSALPQPQRRPDFHLRHLLHCRWLSFSQLSVVIGWFQPVPWYSPLRT